MIAAGQVKKYPFFQFPRIQIIEARVYFDIRKKITPSDRLIFLSQYCSQVPDRPDFPEGYDIKQSIAVGSRTKKDVNWFLCESEQDMM